MNVASKESIEEDLASGSLHSDIFIITKDNNRYHVGDWGYQIKNDTLYVKGLKINPNGEEPFDGKIAMDDISHFEVEEAEPLATVGVVLGVAAFAMIVLGAIMVNSASNDVKECSQR
ncbi:MAG: hypothetical protein KAI99_03425 [Cyclobacteriaceae bacterium]|nr:hypothetical protein [Cyclobacteriaceae bacterium]